jgi:hypothetical protein
VEVYLSAMLAKTPQYCTQRNVKKDGGDNPVFWISDTFGEAKSAIGYAKDAFSGKDVLSNAWNAAKSVGSIVSSIGSLFSMEERLARILHAMSPDVRRAVWEFVMTHDIPTREVCAQAIVYHWHERRRVRAIRPAPSNPFEQESLEAKYRDEDVQSDAGHSVRTAALVSRPSSWVQVTEPEKGGTAAQNAALPRLVTPRS